MVFTPLSLQGAFWASDPLPAPPVPSCLHSSHSCYTLLSPWGDVLLLLPFFSHVVALLFGVLSVPVHPVVTASALFQLLRVDEQVPSLSGQDGSGSVQCWDLQCGAGAGLWRSHWSGFLQV